MGMVRNIMVNNAWKEASRSITQLLNTCVFVGYWRVGVPGDLF